MKFVRLAAVVLAALSFTCASCAKKQTAAPAPGYVEYGK
jgi:hypothetical protein